MRKLTLIVCLLIPLTCVLQTRNDSLKKILNSKNSKTYLPTLLELCWEYRYSKPDSARIYGFEALEISSRNGNKSQEAEALHNIAITYEAQGDYAKALEYNFKALKLRYELADKIKTANTLNNIGIAYDELGNFTLALKHYKAAYAIYKSKNDKEKLAMVDLNLGILFKAHEDYREVIKYYQEAYSIYKELKMPLEAAFAEANLGSVYYYTKQYDSCLYFSLKAQKELKAQNILQFLPVTYANAGIAYFELGDIPKASKLLNLALSNHSKFGNKKEMSFCNIHLGRIMLKKKDYPAAKIYLTDAIKLAEKIGAGKQVMDAKEILSEVFKEEKNFEEAYGAFIGYSTIKDSLFKKEKTRLVSDFQTKYETEKKELRIKNLNQENTIQKLEIKQRNVYLFIAGLFFLFFINTSFFIYNRRKLKARAEIQEEINRQQDIAARAVLDAEERERRRIAGDLHDGVGQMLSAALMNLNGLFQKLGLRGEESLQAEQSLALVNDSYDEMRSISHQMMPNALIKAGLASAVKEFLNKIDKNKIKIILETEGLNNRLDEQTETVLYRVIQETVTNVIKHSKANKLNIQLNRDEEGISVTVEDNGIGFDKSKTDLKSGIGLSNIYSRVEFLKGTVDIDTSPGKGTLVAIYIPNQS